MTLRLSILVLLLATVGCVGPSKKAILSPSEVAEWYERWSLPSTINRGIGYQGSDEAFHYFIARPIDYFVFIQVPRDQLKLEDVRPKQQASSSGLGVHYWVDPLHDFRKKEADPDGQRTTRGM